jgi:hypothetical protein
MHPNSWLGSHCIKFILLLFWTNRRLEISITKVTCWYVLSFDCLNWTIGNHGTQSRFMKFLLHVHKVHKSTQYGRWNSFQMKYGGKKNQHENKWSYFGYLSLTCKSSNSLNAFIVDYHNRNHDLMVSCVLKQNELFEMLNYKWRICMFSPSISSTMGGKKIIEQILNVLLKYKSIKEWNFLGHLKNESLSFRMPKFYLKKIK